MEYHIFRQEFVKRNSMSREVLMDKWEYNIPVNEPNQFSKIIEASSTAIYQDIPIPKITPNYAQPNQNGTTPPASPIITEGINYGLVVANATQDFPNAVPVIQKGMRMPFYLKMKTSAGVSEFLFYNGMAFLPNDLQELSVMLFGEVGDALVTAYFG